MLGVIKTFFQGCGINCWWGGKPTWRGSSMIKGNNATWRTPCGIVNNNLFFTIIVTVTFKNKTFYNFVR